MDADSDISLGGTYWTPSTRKLSVSVPVFRSHTPQFSINTSIFSQTGENNGIGFAIPIATAKNAADKLVAGQSVAKAGLGLTGPSTTPDGASGAYVKSVTPGGPADSAGIQPGDLITAVDDTPIHAFDELRGTISAYNPGETVTVTIERDGQSSQVQVTLGTLGTR